MGDPSSSNGPSIPAWQRTQPNPSSSVPPADQKLSPTGPPPVPRSTLVEQASRFLEEDSIKDAPTDQKIVFLESKGLDNDEIQGLLGVSRNLEASSKEDNPVSDTQSSDASSVSNSTPHETTLPTPLSTPATTPSRDIPPVITYPEFLLQPQKPPPIITARRLLYTLYLTGGLAAVFYGTSKFLVAPMLESLTSARHDFALLAQSNLAKLNDKLTANVSKIPPSSPRIHHPTDADDVDSITSDPTELFHRDIATQTTPTLTRSVSASSTASSSSESRPKPDITVSHTQRLNILHSHLAEFVAAENDAVTSMGESKDAMNDLQSYLDTLTYSSVSSGYVNGIYGAMYGGGSDGASGGTGNGQEDDAVSKFKAEIRGVKGALLSARNFPSRGAGRVR